MAEMANPKVPIAGKQIETGDSAVERRLARTHMSVPFIIACVGALLAISADTQLLTIIPLLGRLEKSLGMSASQGALSLSITGIAFAATVPISSRLGDMFGFRRLLLVSVVLVVVGNIICASADDPIAFIAGRAVMGFSAALPLFYALLRLRADTIRGIDRYAGLMTGAIGAGIVVSFLLGGLVLQAGGTARDVLWVMTALSVLVLVLVWLFIPDSHTRTNVTVDYPGAILIALAFGLVVTGFDQGNEWGWTAAGTLTLLAAGVALLPVWGWWELTAKHPLIDLRVVKRREIWPAFLAAGIASMVAGASCLMVSNYVQTPTIAGYGFGGTVLIAALYLLPQGFIVAFGGGVMTPIIRVLGQRNAAILGGLLITGFFFWFSANNYSQTWQFVIESIAMGTAWSLTYTASYSAYLRATRPGEGGMLNGAAQATGQGINALGPAIVTALVTASFIPHTPIPAGNNYGHVWFFFGTCGIAVALLSLLIRNSRVDQHLAPNTEIVGPAKPKAMGPDEIAV